MRVRGTKQLGQDEEDLTMAEPSEWVGSRLLFENDRVGSGTYRWHRASRWRNTSIDSIT